MASIGLDLTDPYAAHARPVDVAILDGALRCTFTQLPWLPAPSARWTLSLDAVTRGPASGDVLVIDGPLALATAGNSTRACERALRAPGHTADVLPTPGSRPFAGFMRGAVELAGSLVAAGWRIAHGESEDAATLFEGYPGAAWPVLAAAQAAPLRTALPVKSSAAGQAARRALLEAAGVVLPAGPLTHDALDAAICALLGHWRRTAPARTVLVGQPCSSVDGALREGCILQPAAPNGVPPPRARRR